MDSKCYCGEELLPDPVTHLLGCHSWKECSMLYRAFHSEDSSSFLVHELEALKCLALQQAADAKSKLVQAKDHPCREEESLQCVVCLRLSTSMHGLSFLNCGHLVCESHITECLRTQFPVTATVCCPVSGCGYVLSMEEVLQTVPEKEFERLRDASLQQFSHDSDLPLVTCKCGETIQVEPGQPEPGLRDLDGAELTAEAMQHLTLYRVRCRRCQAVLCAGCNESPYHIGKSCAEYSQFKAAKRCRYCDTIVDSVRPLCRKEECQQLYAMACKKILACDHQCYGVKNEPRCFGCLNEHCCPGTPNEHDYCTICYIDVLGASPCVQLDCKHILHYPCVLQALTKRWAGPHITFKFAECPACKEWLSNSLIAEKMKAVLELRDEILEKALVRLKRDNLETDWRLMDPTCSYFNRLDLFALDTYTYYECFRCKKPYFGGRKECEQNLGRNNFDPEELVCPTCAAGEHGSKDCPEHGREFLEFKCKFCCSIAVWYCWGTTHFCDACHSRQNAGDYMTSKPQSQLPQCAGAHSCPLHVDHPPNGQEFALGCALCR